MAKNRAASPIKQGLDRVTAARKALHEATARKQAQQALRPAERKRAAAAIGRAAGAELRAQLAAVRAAGLYVVKLAPGQKPGELSRGQKARTRAAYRQLEELSRSAVFARYPSVKPAEKKRLAAVVKREGGRATKRGVFVKREEGEMRAGETRLVRERETGLYKIVQVHRYTDKAGARTAVTADVYLEGAEALERQQAALRRRWDRAVAGLGTNERIRFTIGGPNGNVSRQTFTSWDVFMRHVQNYRRDPRAQATFMASLVIYTVARDSPRATRWRQPTGWIDKAGRLHRPGSENLYGGELFPLPKRNRSKFSRKR